MVWSITTVVYAQIHPEYNSSYLQKLIDSDSLSKAGKLIDEAIVYHQEKRNLDTLVKFISLAGSLKLNDNNSTKSIQQAEKIADYLVKSNNVYVAGNALREMAWMQANYGNSNSAYDLLQQALEFAKKIPDPKLADIHIIEYSLGYNAAGMNNYPLSKKHYLNSLKLQKKYDPEDYESFQMTYNALGGIMWQEAKLDSSAYYFEESLKVLAKTDKSDLLNQYYRPSLVKMNLSILMNALGKNQDAIDFVQEAVKGFEKYIQNATDEGRIFQARKHQLVAIENMGSFYNTIGEQKRALELIEFAHRKKKEIFDEANVNLIISNIIVAEAKVANLDYNGAMENVNEALRLIDLSTQENKYWHANAWITKGLIAEYLEDYNTAFQYLDKGETAYRKAIAGKYSKDNLDILMKVSKIYAQHNYREKAEKLALEIYRFGKESDFANTLQDLYHTIHLAEVYFLLQNYEKAIQYSEEAINFQPVESLNSTTDSVLFHYRKPNAIYINTQAKYHTQPKDIDNIQTLLEQVENAISILDQRKQIVVNHDDISILIAENSKLFDLAKKLRLDAYQLTGDEKYLDDLISLHESAIYNRIRSRLKLRETVSNNKIPQKIIEREQFLKNALAQSLDSGDKTLHHFFDTQKEWQEFLDILQIQYPDYYKLKYASIETSLSGLQQNIPQNTTVIRYIFIENNLYAVLLSKNQKKIIPLEYTSVKNHINRVLVHSFDSNQISPLLYELYQTLWKPFDDQIKTDKVVIIPDKELYNLCFEILTPQPIKSYKELVTNSLLAKYVISYNYSLHALGADKEVIHYQSDYVAFAPVFSAQMKEDYKLKITDSVAIDKTYLTLLTQPFSEKLIKKFTKTLDGKSFLNENASKEVFIQQAGEYKIIHIATHAESNNVSPELSRLIFAKKISGGDEFDNNSLYTYEIYNINLASDLAILTACETGKPTHHPGEGMISLAHAFNYSGSKSILTSLWKIDEESSSIIVAEFYENLKNGMDKDVALQQAKLSYINTAEGRAVAPEYWAGMVLMGDTSPIEIKNSPSGFTKIVLALITFLLLIFTYLKFKSKKK